MWGLGVSRLRRLLLPRALPPALAPTTIRMRNPRVCGGFDGADARTRTGDPFITSEVLYQLSYVGEAA